MAGVPLGACPVAPPSRRSWVGRQTLAGPIDDPFRDRVAVVVLHHEMAVAFDANLWQNEHVGGRSACSKDAGRAVAGPQSTPLAACFNEIAVDRYDWDARIEERVLGTGRTGNRLQDYGALDQVRSQSGCLKICSPSPRVQNKDGRADSLQEFRVP